MSFVIFFLGVVVGVTLVALLATRKSWVAYKALPQYEKDAQQLERLARKLEKLAYRQVRGGLVITSQDTVERAIECRSRAEKIRTKAYQPPELMW